MNWTTYDPGAGNMAEIGVYAARVRSRHDALETIRAALVSAHGSADAEAFGGMAGDAWRASVSSILTEISSIKNSLATIESASRTYKAGVDDIAVNAAFVRSRLDSERHSRNMIATYGYDAPGAADQIAEHDRNIAGYKATLEEYANHRLSLDNTYCAALDAAAVIGSRYQRLLDLYGSDAFSGSLSTFFNVRDKQLDEYADLAARIAAGEGTDDDYARLENYLKGLADDPALASEFWLKVGGETAFDVLYQAEQRTQIGDLDELGALASFAAAFRESLAVGSAGWDDSEAVGFAQGLFVDTGPMSGLEVISYLFNDPEGAPMGPALTVATADIFDEWERNPERMFQNGPVIIETPSVRALGQLMFDENSDMGMWDTAGNDPMARVLATLGTYPDAALEWISGSGDDPYWDSRWDEGAQPSLGEGRIAYWFGEREWRDDGFSGAGQLWNGAMSAEGGARDPNAAWNSPALIDQMTASTHILNALGGRADSSFIPEALSPGAQESLGQSLATLLPRLAESPITQDPSGLFNGGDYIDTNVLESTEHLLAPGASFDNISRVWGAVGSTPGGLAHLDAAVSYYTAQLEVIAFSGAEGGPGLSEAFDRIATIEGFHSGSVGGAESLAALRSDEQFQQMVDGVDTVVGLIPIPGLKDIPGISELVVEAGVGWAFDHGQSVVEDAVKDAITARWGDQYSAALASAASSDLAGRDALGIAIAAMLDPSDSSVKASLGIAPDASASEAQWMVDQFISDRQATYGQAHLSALAVNNQDVYEAYQEAAK